MSTKATASSRTAAKVLAEHKRAAQAARTAAHIAKLSADATKAAIAAACAAERVRHSDGSGTGSTVTDMVEIERRVHAATDAAIKHASDAMRAESTGDVVSAVCFANLAARAARQAASLATVSSVIGGMSKEMRSGKETAVPEPSPRDTQSPQPATTRRDTLISAIDTCARYLITYDGKIISAFEREEDAFLFESELAELDQAHGVMSATCEVIERKTGKRLGGYFIAGGKLVVFVRDENQRRFGGGRRSRS